MKLTAIRHTRVEVPPGICYGQTDVPVAKTYDEEMAAVKTQTDWYEYDAVYSSPLNRCRRLAEDIFPRELIVFDDRLKELNFGRWEMQPWDAISETDEAKRWFQNFVDVPADGGESFRDQINRTAAFLEELKQRPFKKVAVVAHGGILRALFCLLNGTEPLDAFQQKVDYGDVVRFDL
ncbi:alpha-ribazole phosphatase [Mangrovibacterium sp.]|uniref:alpha-ribazole phosphatase n=1 Tax=Mangrovibacterium sp. TaxID=1961364 RepID=UPI00356624FC